LNKKAKGEYTEALFIPKFISMGYSISIPFGNNQRYDMILDDGVRLIKIQCKTAWPTKGGITFSASSCNGWSITKKSYRGQVDFFAIYSPELHKFYLVPVNDVPTNCVLLRIEKTLSGMKKRCRWAKDYEI